ncbi:MAG TPA: HIT family protein [Spirochaetaceae bacterium]|nr:HIT family protein [Spirochaetaceae bacterium]
MPVVERLATYPACPFCRLSEDQLFYDGPLVVGIWDSHPVSPGHALLIPKRHMPTLFDATVEERAELLSAIDEARKAIEATRAPDGYNVGINIGEAAGQTVFHLHLHVIPRYAGDVPNPRGGVRKVLRGRPERNAADHEDDDSPRLRSVKGL